MTQIVECPKCGETWFLQTTMTAIYPPHSCLWIRVKLTNGAAS